MTTWRSRVPDPVSSYTDERQQQRSKQRGAGVAAPRQQYGKPPGARTAKAPGAGAAQLLVKVAGPPVQKNAPQKSDEDSSSDGDADMTSKTKGTGKMDESEIDLDSYGPGQVPFGGNPDLSHRQAIVETLDPELDALGTQAVDELEAREQVGAAEAAARLKKAKASTRRQEAAARQQQEQADAEVERQQAEVERQEAESAAKEKQRAEAERQSALFHLNQFRTPPADFAGPAAPMDERSDEAVDEQFAERLAAEAVKAGQQAKAAFARDRTLRQLEVKAFNSGDDDTLLQAVRSQETRRPTIGPDRPPPRASAADLLSQQQPFTFGPAEAASAENEDSDEEDSGSGGEKPAKSRKTAPGQTAKGQTAKSGRKHARGAGVSRADMASDFKKRLEGKDDVIDKLKAENNELLKKLQAEKTVEKELKKGSAAQTKEEIQKLTERAELAEGQLRALGKSAAVAAAGTENEKDKALTEALLGVATRKSLISKLQADLARAEKAAQDTSTKALEAANAARAKQTAMQSEINGLNHSVDTLERSKNKLESGADKLRTNADRAPVLAARVQELEGKEAKLRETLAESERRLGITTSVVTAIRTFTATPEFKLGFRFPIPVLPRDAAELGTQIVAQKMVLVVPSDVEGHIQSLLAERDVERGALLASLEQIKRDYQELDQKTGRAIRDAGQTAQTLAEQKEKVAQDAQAFKHRVDSSGLLPSVILSSQPTSGLNLFDGVHAVVDVQKLRNEAAQNIQKAVEAAKAVAAAERAAALAAAEAKMAELQQNYDLQALQLKTASSFNVMARGGKLIQAKEDLNTLTQLYKTQLADAQKEHALLLKQAVDRSVQDAKELHRLQSGWNNAKYDIAQLQASNALTTAAHDADVKRVALYSDVATKLLVADMSKDDVGKLIDAVTVLRHDIGDRFDGADDLQRQLQNFAAEIARLQKENGMLNEKARQFDQAVMLMDEKDAEINGFRTALLNALNHWMDLYNYHVSFREIADRLLSQLVSREAVSPLGDELDQMLDRMVGTIAGNTNSSAAIQEIGVDFQALQSKVAQYLHAKPQDVINAMTAYNTAVRATAATNSKQIDEWNKQHRLAFRKQRGKSSLAVSSAPPMLLAVQRPLLAIRDDNDDRKIIVGGHAKHKVTLSDSDSDDSGDDSEDDDAVVQSIFTPMRYSNYVSVFTLESWLSSGEWDLQDIVKGAIEADDTPHLSFGDLLTDVSDAFVLRTRVLPVVAVVSALQGSDDNKLLEEIGMPAPVKAPKRAAQLLEYFASSKAAFNLRVAQVQAAEMFPMVDEGMINLDWAISPSLLRLQEALIECQVASMEALVHRDIFMRTKNPDHLLQASVSLATVALNLRVHLLRGGDEYGYVPMMCDKWKRVFAQWAALVDAAPAGEFAEWEVALARHDPKADWHNPESEQQPIMATMAMQRLLS